MDLESKHNNFNILTNVRAKAEDDLRVLNEHADALENEVKAENKKVEKNQVDLEQLNQTLQQLMFDRNNVNVQQNLTNVLQQLLVMGGCPAGGLRPGGGPGGPGGPGRDDDDDGDGGRRLRRHSTSKISSPGSQISHGAPFRAKPSCWAEAASHSGVNAWSR